MRKAKNVHGFLVKFAWLPPVLPQMLSMFATVFLLYYMQGVVPHIGVVFEVSLTLASLVPGAVLLGYAVGVGSLAFQPINLISYKMFILHALFLVVSLAAAAAATSLTLLIFISFFVGVGCSLTQRLLYHSTSSLLPKYRSRVIGLMIASGLLGVVVARAYSVLLIEELGWQYGLIIILISNSFVYSMAISNIAQSDANKNINVRYNGSMISLWDSSFVLRIAVKQSVSLFMVFMLIWAIFPQILTANGYEIDINLTALVSVSGVFAAIFAGILCSKFNPNSIAIIGLLLVISSIFALSAIGMFPPYLGMILLELGMQISLVSNQVRVQKISDVPVVRGRLLALLTTTGFLGGAIGVSSSQILVEVFGIFGVLAALLLMVIIINSPTLITIRLLEITKVITRSRRAYVPPALWSFAPISGSKVQSCEVNRKSERHMDGAASSTSIS